jgi:DNA-binding transcriptional LysR family regulator
VLRGRPFDRWTLSLNGVVEHMQVSGTIMSDDAEVIRRLAIAGEGFAYKSALDVSDDIRAGRLQVLLPHYQGMRAAQSDFVRTASSFLRRCVCSMKRSKRTVKGLMPD